MSDSKFPHSRSFTYHRHFDDLPKSGLLPYSLTNDYLFRASLQTNPKAAKGLICALLDLNPDDVLSCNILNPIILGEHLEEKDCVLDVRLLLNNQKQINLEMQVELLKNWQNRSIYYLSRMFTDLKLSYGHANPPPLFWKFRHSCARLISNRSGTTRRTHFRFVLLGVSFTCGYLEGGF